MSEYTKQLEKMRTDQIIDELSHLERKFTQENFDKISDIAWEMISRYDDDVSGSSLEDVIRKHRLLSVKVRKQRSEAER